jgi:hypothetical protein
VAYWIAFYGGTKNFPADAALPFLSRSSSAAWLEFIPTSSCSGRENRPVPQNFHVLATSTAVIAGIA